MTIELNRLIDAHAKVLLVGPPGIGKTARIRAAASDKSLDVVTLRAGIADRIDIGGAIVPDMTAGVARELPLETIAGLRASTKPTILFLDDLGQAPMDVQAACMRLFDPGYLPDNVLIWGATNRPGDKAGVVALCEPLRSRFDVAFRMALPPQVDTEGDNKRKPKVKSAEAASSVVLGEWRDELAAWCGWALDQKAPATVVAWHRATEGRTLYQWEPDADPAARYPDYRSWESVIRLQLAGLYSLEHVAACIGYPAALEYHAYMQMGAKLPTPSQIAADPKRAHVPDEPAALWLVATACGAALSVDNAAPVLQYLGRVPRVYTALAVRDAWRRCGNTLSKAPAWSAWFEKNQEIFA